MELTTIAYGTYRQQKEAGEHAIRQAAEAGYRHFDTATFYKNFSEVQKGLSGLDRAAYHLTSKVWPDSLNSEQVRQDLDACLSALNTRFLDEYLIHWPNKAVPLAETLGTMHALKTEGKVRSVGMSNVTVAHIEQAAALGFEVDVVQVEMNPLFMDLDLLSYCHSNNIVVEAWGPFKQDGSVLSNPLLQEIATEIGVTPAQVTVKWILQHNVIPIVGSSTPHHMKQNRDVFGFQLSGAQMKSIDQQATQGSRIRVDFDEFDQ